ncbi:MAG: immunoglobulin domain-containing protein [Verrucomicrobiae bacterium]|nr:immunoglobulin domain-containing protein [Verrucomicrobiae bacterium]
MDKTVGLRYFAVGVVIRACAMKKLSVCLQNLVQGGAGIGLLFGVILAQQLVAQTPAFPGAEGCGRFASGGRGGDVYYVTNLNDSGPGSLRNGISTAPSTGRTILFKVSGTIDLASDLTISKSNITIAGQTAPGDGITLRRRSLTLSRAQNVIIRHIRVRPGDVDTNFEGDAIWVYQSTNVILDHVSASWSVDECLSVTYSTNVTVQWCMISESLNNSQHQKGAHGYGSLLRYGAGALTFHHNLYQHHKNRNPRLGDRIKLDFVNNVIYNWGDRAGYSADDSADNPGGFTNYINYVGNYLIAGPSTKTPNTAFASGTTNTVIYQSGNMIDSNKNGLLDGSNTGWGMFSGFPYTAASSRYPLPEVATDAAAVAYQRVLAFGGAWLARDAVDRRLIQTVRMQTGMIVDAVGPSDQATDYVTNTINGTNYIFVRGWPVLNSAVPPVDTDNDGIPDYWEVAMGWNPAVANNNRTNADGYTDLEWYINWLAEPRAVTACNQAVDVSLRALTGDNPSLAFYGLGTTNGTVALLGDGATARFTPPTNFVGLTSFNFWATNTADRIAFGPVWVTVMVSNVPPAIVLQPSNRIVSPGQTVTFEVAASGGRLAYQWRRNGVNLTNDARVAGATAALLVISNVTAADIGQYSVVVSNYYGAVTSAVATLTVLTNTAPVLGPIPDIAVIAGTPINFVCTATDTDQPPQRLTFTLLDAPPGASIGAESGRFTWRPGIAQAGTTNRVTLAVTDDGVPSLSATQAFTIAVLRPAAPQLRMSSAGLGPITLQIAGDLGPDYIVQASTNLIDWIELCVTNPAALPFQWTDPDATNYAQRFYRVVLGP